MEGREKDTTEGTIHCTVKATNNKVFFKRPGMQMETKVLIVMLIFIYILLLIPIPIPNSIKIQK